MDPYFHPCQNDFFQTRYSKFAKDVMGTLFPKKIPENLIGFKQKTYSIHHLCSKMENIFKNQLQYFHQTKESCLQHLQYVYGITPDGDNFKTKIKDLIYRINIDNQPELIPLQPDFLQQLFSHEVDKLMKKGIKQPEQYVIRAITIFVIRFTCNSTYYVYNKRISPLKKLCGKAAFDKGDQIQQYSGSSTTSYSNKEMPHGSGHDFEKNFCACFQKFFQNPLITVLTKQESVQTARLIESVQQFYLALGNEFPKESTRDVWNCTQKQIKFDDFSSAIQNFLPEYVANVLQNYDFKNVKIFRLYESLFTNNTKHQTLQKLLLKKYQKEKKDQEQKKQMTTDNEIKFLALKYAYLFTTGSLQPDALFLVKQGYPQLKLSYEAKQTPTSYLRFIPPQNQLKIQQPTLLVCQLTHDYRRTQEKYAVLQRYCFYASYYKVVDKTSGISQLSCDPVGIIGCNGEYNAKVLDIINTNELFGNLYSMHQENHLFAMWMRSSIKDYSKQWNAAVKQIVKRKRLGSSSKQIIMGVLNEYFLEQQYDQGIICVILQNLFNFSQKNLKEKFEQDVGSSFTQKGAQFVLDQWQKILPLQEKEIQKMITSRKYPKGNSVDSLCIAHPIQKNQAQRFKQKLSSKHTKPCNQFQPQTLSFTAQEQKQTLLKHVKPPNEIGPKSPQLQSLKSEEMTSAPKNIQGQQSSKKQSETNKPIQLLNPKASDFLPPNHPEVKRTALSKQQKEDKCKKGSEND